VLAFLLGDLRMGHAARFSSATCEWATPQDFFDRLNAGYQFTLDPCATPGNAKCARYFTREQDGLAQPWKGRVWLNPPYGRTIGLWMAKAKESVKSGDAELVVCLVPARVDTRWWNDSVAGAEVEFIRGRLRFGGAENSAPSRPPSWCFVTLSPPQKRYETGRLKRRHERAHR
jgi:phage N-6-adenine-methyltransferase